MNIPHDIKYSWDYSPVLLKIEIPSMKINYIKFTILCTKKS